MVNINIEVPEDIHKKVKILAASKGISLKELITQALEEGADENK
jgi:predicted HicB family RNase H-like nuclease